MNKKKIDSLQKDITMICDYLKEEKKHYQESGCPRDHIWCHVKKAKEWLETQPTSKNPRDKIF